MKKATSVPFLKRLPSATWMLVVWLVFLLACEGRLATNVLLITVS
jgi:hypothetical protein